MTLPSFLPGGVVAAHDQHGVVLALQRSAYSVADDVEHASIVVRLQCCRRRRARQYCCSPAVLPTTSSTPVLLFACSAPVTWLSKALLRSQPRQFAATIAVRVGN
jgi:hypothetical protein